MIKKIIPLGLAISMLIPTIASAETLKQGVNSAKAPYATELKAEREIIKTNRDTNKALRASIKDKVAQIKVLVAQSKADKTLKTKQDSLKAQKAVVKTDREALKAINTNLKPIVDKAKADKAAKDFSALLNDLKSIPDFQTSKTPVLQKINSDLDSIITLLSSKS